jgi:putative tricarboxylic transport membrane protein
VAAGVPLLLGIIAGAFSVSLGVGTFTHPEPGLWPLLVSLALVTAAVVLVVRRQARAGCERFTRTALLALAGAASLVVLVLLFDRTGFEIPTLLVLAFWLRVLGRESLLVTVTVALGTTAALYAIFILALGVPLPHIVVL